MNQSFGKTQQQLFNMGQQQQTFQMGQTQQPLQMGQMGQTQQPLQMGQMGQTQQSLQMGQMGQTQKPFQMGQMGQTQQPSQMGQMGQTQQPLQMGQMGQQQFQMGQLEQQRQHNQRLHLQNVQIILQKIYQLQNQPQLQQLIQKLMTQQKFANDEIRKVMDQADVKKINEQEVKQIKRKGQKIKEKNTILLSRLLIVKSKLERLMYQNMNSNSKYEYQTSQALDKIRSLKGQITQKCAYIKTLKFNELNEYPQKKNLSAQSDISQVGTKGTEILQREVLKQKTDMEFLAQELKQKN